MVVKGPRVVGSVRSVESQEVSPVRDTRTEKERYLVKGGKGKDKKVDRLSAV